MRQIQKTGIKPRLFNITIQMGMLCLALMLSSAMAVAQQRPPQPKLQPGQSKQRLREEWIYKARAYPENTIPVNALQDAWEQAQALPIVRPTGASRSGFAGGDWEFWGPNANVKSFDGINNFPLDISCRVNAIAIHPTTPSTLYIGVAKGGLWKSTDSGTTWTNLTDSLSSQASGCVVLEPGNPNTVYFGTGEGYQSGGPNTTFGVGIFKSTNGGATWTLIGNSTFAGKNVNDIVIDPGNTNHWIVATSAGIYTTNDGGANFTLRQAGNAWTVRMHPTTTTTLYAALGNIYGHASNGVYKSTDGGVTWTVQTGGGLPSGTAVGRINLDICKANGNVVYAVFAHPANHNVHSIWKTTNGSASWASTTNGADPQEQQAWYDLLIRVSPTDPNTAFVGVVRLIRTTNGGTSWTDVNFGQDQHAMAFDSTDATSQKIYLGGDPGLSYTTNAGGISGGFDGWARRNVGRGTMEFYSFDIHPTNPAQLMAGAQDNGVFLRTANLTPSVPNNTYVHIEWADGMAAAYNFADPSKVVYSIQLCYTFASTDGGLTRSLVFNNPNGDRAPWVTTLVNDHATPNRFYLGTYRAYRSNDNGTTWGFVSPDLATGGATLNVITVAPSNSNVVYTGSGNGKVWVCTTASSLANNAANTASWTDRSAGLPNASIGGIVVDPTNPAILYVSFQRYGQPKVYKSVNSGAAWTNITGNLPDTAVNDLVLHPADPTTLFAATDTGVLVTSDNGATWARYGTGMPTGAWCTALRASSTHLTVSTYGRAMWRVPFTTATQWYVDKVSGLDTNPGTAASPFKTVNRAVTAASAGHTIYVKQGNYGTDTGRIIKGVRLVNWGNTGMSRIGQP